MKNDIGFEQGPWENICIYFVSIGSLHFSYNRLRFKLAHFDQKMILDLNMPYQRRLIWQYLEKYGF